MDALRQALRREAVPLMPTLPIAVLFLVVLVLLFYYTPYFPYYYIVWKCNTILVLFPLPTTS